MAPLTEKQRSMNQILNTLLSALAVAGIIWISTEVGGIDAIAVEQRYMKEDIQELKSAMKKDRFRGSDWDRERGTLVEIHKNLKSGIDSNTSRIESLEYKYAN